MQEQVAVETLSAKKRFSFTGKYDKMWPIGGNALKKTLKKPRPRTAFGQVCSQLAQRFFTHDVGRDSAALAYYLLFALFPLMILASLLIGALDIDISAFISDLSQFTPADVSSVIGGYLTYVVGNRNRYLLLFSLVFSIWFPMRATNTLTHSVRKAFGRLAPEDRMKNMLFVALYSVLLVVTISVAILLTVVGRQAMKFLSHFFRLTEMFINLWAYLRFVLLFVVLALAIGAMYMLALGERRPLREVMPGVIASLVLWMVLSIAFAYYVGNVAHYAVLYGSIATAIVVLLWLYMSAMALILGAELAGIISARRQEKAAALQEEFL